MYNFTFKNIIHSFFLSLFSKNCIWELKEWYKLCIKRICPICKTKLHKNKLGIWNCAKCFSNFLKTQGV